ncbi:hypothetical protein AAGT75_004717 [Escherichia coli]
MTKKEQAVFDRVKNSLNEAIVKKMLAGEAADERTLGALAVINGISDELAAINAPAED